MRTSWIESGCAVLLVQGLAAGAVLLASRGERHLRKALPLVVAAAVGVLLGTGLFHLLPESLEALGRGAAVWLVVAGTVAALFGFERLVHRISGVSVEPAPDIEGQPCDDLHTVGHSHAAARPATLLTGALTHSLVDGTSIAAAFAVNARLGWVTAAAVALHEVPHRIGDFALLLHMELPRGRSAALAMAAGLASFLGWLLVVFLGDAAPATVAWLLPVSAGSFLYISMFDLLPEVLTGARGTSLGWRIFAIALGAAGALAWTRLPGA